MTDTTPEPADVDVPDEDADDQVADGPGAEGAEPRNVSRPGVLKRLVNLYDAPRYLEIGVNKGATFSRVPAAVKVAVDPKFLFDHAQWAADDPTATFHEITSDDYFARVIGRDEQFDVIYLDGLHTFEQTLRDLMNALDHLQPDGVIVIDDTNPPSWMASIADHDRFFEARRRLQAKPLAWMGDVFKLIWFVDTFCPQLSFGTIENNHGQTVLWRHRRADVTERTYGRIDAVSFEDVVMDRDVLRVERFGEIRKRLRGDLGL